MGDKILEKDSKTLKKEFIIRESLALFKKHGVKSMSVDRLTKSLKISRRALYQHFGDKMGLLSACLDLNYVQEREAGAAIKQQADNALDALQQLGQLVLKREFNLNPNFYYDILNYYPELRQASIDRNESFNRNETAELILRGKSEGLILPETDEKLAAEVFITLYETLITKEIHQKFPYKKEDFMMKAISPYFRGICTSQGLSILENQINQ